MTSQKVWKPILVQYSVWCECELAASSAKHWQWTLQWSIGDLASNSYCCDMQKNCRHIIGAEDAFKSSMLVKFGGNGRQIPQLAETVGGYHQSDSGKQQWLQWWANEQLLPYRNTERTHASSSYANLADVTRPILHISGVFNEAETLGAV